MALFELTIKSPAQPSSGGMNIAPLVDAQKDVAKSNREATAHSDHRHTDTRQISAEERYGLINIWQEVFGAIGIWRVEEIQRTGVKLNDGTYNYIYLKEDAIRNTYNGEQIRPERYYLAHISAADPFLREQMAASYNGLIFGTDMLEQVSSVEFKEKRLPSMNIGWLEPK